MAANKSKAFNIDYILESLKNCESVRTSWINMLCEKSKEILMKEDTLLSLMTPLTICGDIHGQFQDLMELFTIGGDAPYMSYLFLGDYVDRGYNGIETFVFLLGLKVKYPSRVFLLRGNHESKEITQVYGFYDECLRKFGSIGVWQTFLEVFNLLSLGAIIDNRILCIHGGLSPSLSTIDKIRTIDRFHEVPQTGPMSDLLWSDPDEAKGWNISPRGAGFLFGADVVDQFRTDNAIDYICRAHQLVLEGFKWHFKKTVLTVWSAPNYCYRCGNLASIFELAQGLQGTFTLFEAAPTQIYKANQTKTPPEYFL